MRSFTGSLITAPTILEATSSARSVPSPKCEARATPLLTTEIASAVLNVPLGDFNLLFPSNVIPPRSSRNSRRAPVRLSKRGLNIDELGSG